ncbi:hypothetical protein IMF27_25100 [Pseudomonas sp. PCH199]|uniref:hypothetical protein n=1 Tax=unclassified Pseudomonas TaxID=196821 RepID=UPI000BCA9692|nr:MULTISPECIES: hypothetical protein [unclassified Pseudomonas]MCW8278433.1 hypothetical protein [Pseudomonas sp. PCH199]PAM81363.1 hypothetical protein CES87_25625 [Pseudomonas sp. ERMR1:02]
MNSFKNLLTPAQERRLLALQSWHRAFENRALRMSCPDTYHEELLRQADEMDRRGIVDWEEWRDLRVEADQAYLRAVAGEDYHTVEPRKTMCETSILSADSNII